MKDNIIFLGLTVALFLFNTAHADPIHAYFDENFDADIIKKM